MNILQIQTRLTELGYDPGKIDGLPGRLTRNAIAAFQRDNGLTDDGVAGSITLAKLFPNVNIPTIKDSIPSSMPWLIEAFRLINIAEFEGEANNPIIMNWASKLSLRYTGDRTPWCGLYMSHCIASQLPEAPLPTDPLLAQRWKSFGKKTTPQFGAMLVFWRGDPTSWKGHIGFYWAEDKTHYHVLGGNQNNKVNIARVAKKRLIVARWPDGFFAPGFTRHATREGVITTVNEE